MSLSRWLLSRAGWSVEITAPQRDKCVICVAPHTSNYDFILGLLAYRSIGRRANFLMKAAWFFFPVGYLMKALGGIPVHRSRSTDLTTAIIADYSKTQYLNLAITPEGTRSPAAKWRTGFLRIARGAGVPVQLGIIDYKTRKVIIKDEFRPTGDTDVDLQAIKDYYAQYGNCARYPEKFI